MIKEEECPSVATKIYVRALVCGRRESHLPIATVALKRKKMNCIKMRMLSRKRDFSGSSGQKAERSVSSVLKFNHGGGDDHQHGWSLEQSRMAELKPDAVAWALDRDFQDYRKQGRQSLSLVAPW